MNVKECPECGMDMLANHCLNCHRFFSFSCADCGRVGYCRDQYKGGCGGKNFQMLTPEIQKQWILQTDKRTKKDSID